MIGKLAAIALGVAVAAHGGALAAPFPERPVTLVAPFAAGGTSDALARATAEGMSKPLKQRIVVENKAGAGGTVGLASVAKAAPDGYTIGLGGVGSLVHSAGVYAGRLTFDVKKDFVPLALLGTTPVAVAVSTSLGVSNLKELAELARRQPGGLTYGSAGVGGALHLGAELFQKLAGVKLVHSPYRGVAPALTDLLGGHIPIVFADVSSAAAHHGQGKVRIIAVAARERVPQLPDVATAAEQGFPNLVVQVWYGLVAPSGTPADVTAALSKAAQDVAASPEFERLLLQSGFTGLTGDRAAFERLIDSELALWLPIIKDAKITAE